MISSGIDSSWLKVMKSATRLLDSLRRLAPDDEMRSKGIFLFAPLAKVLPTPRPSVVVFGMLGAGFDRLLAVECVSTSISVSAALEGSSRPTSALLLLGLSRLSGVTRLH